VSQIIDGFLFEAGWWSVGTWVAFGITTIVISVGMSRAMGLMSVALILGGPFVAFSLIPVLRALADPEPGCISECEGRLVTLAVSAGVFLGWILGLAVGGVIHVRRRKPGP
jgi:hypothetical protein